MSNQTKILIAVALQIVLVLAIPFYKNLEKENSTIIFLNAQPADPIDPLRGHFVRFSYPGMSDAYDHTSQRSFGPGQSLYIPIPGTTMHSFGNTDITHNTPDDPSDYLKGNIIDVINTSTGWGYKINFGIEDYFIPEDKAPRGPLPQGQWKAKIRVDENRVGTLEQMYLDNTPWP